MESRAPYRTSAPPRGPRNLAPHVAKWLRGLGFMALEADHGAIATVEAHWDGPAGQRFYFTYEWSALKALVSLTLTHLNEDDPLVLINSQHVGHLREARRLLHDDERFRAAWLTAKEQPISAAP